MARRILIRAGFLFCVAAGLALPAPLWARDAPLIQVAPGVYVRPGVVQDATAANDDAIANIGFIVGHDAVAVIDPGGSAGDGARLRAQIKAKTGLPIRYLIYTHVHPDHVLGAAAFALDHPVVVAHTRFAAAWGERGGYYRQGLARILGGDPVQAGDALAPTQAVDTSADIDLGGRVLHVTAYGAAHTDSDLTVYDGQTRTLWAGDLLFQERIPALDGSLTGWLTVLGQLKALPAVRVVPGHGPAQLPWPAGAADEERYLTTLARDVRALLKNGGDIDAAATTVARSERGRWKLFDAYNGRNAVTAFKQLEWEDPS
ncbi:quinoprotein relay system zinc metallohydrolase 2 [Nitrospirillum amazonense]|uniref:Quinoprotein relay system zinc metallohydrolase 2 n=1 Tax=Nitrospirillum amazonense TaxID=28077 RepID=A0A560JLZ4_9PROT|nr:quinoprotein relay system zinc metallohydrolase 2 [Nitrospirillum amazonense]MDG3442909.1 quinoprotein relay system zinc metallohydrolase 2 [Nitrospirillum amazonense]TWB71977.1 quinoprotein relay system zinc metallohydrolase 2 [Nitrospirillum amazonense]